MSTDYKLQAKRLRTSLAEGGVEVTHSEALELVAHQYGARDWNTLAAQPPTGDGPREFGPVIPVLRIFDVAKAREFYTDFLGFAIDWEHTFEDHMPVYLQASREGCLLHLSEHHGDASPAATVRILVTDVMRLHRELHEREYRYARPGVETQPWGLEVTVLDPFANRIVFHQLVEDAVGPRRAAARRPGRSSTSSPSRARPRTRSRSSPDAARSWWHAGLRTTRAQPAWTIEPAVGGACTDAHRRRLGVPLGHGHRLGAR